MQEFRDARAKSVSSKRYGYIQSIDNDRMLEFAQKRDLVVRMRLKIGEFVAENETLVSLLENREISKEIEKEINNIFVVSRYRTIEQDSAFGVRQIVDIALKALSPGVNDTTTAVICIEHLSAILARLASRRIEVPFRTDAAGNVRIISKGETFESLLRLSFDQIRESGAENRAVLHALLEALRRIAAQTVSERRLGLLREQMQLVEELGERLESAYDSRLFAEEIETARGILKEK